MGSDFLLAIFRVLKIDTRGPCVWYRRGSTWRCHAVVTLINLMNMTGEMEKKWNKF